MHIQLFSFRICLSQQFRTISVLNRNLLQQVEMWLRHVYFHCHTTLSTVHAYYVILSKKFPQLEDLALPILAYTTGTTSKHQRVMWPELYWRLIVFLRIVVWHMRVSARLLYVWGYGAGCCGVSKNVAKMHFYFEYFKICFPNIVTANRWRCNMHVILS